MSLRPPDPLGAGGRFESAAASALPIVHESNRVQEIKSIRRGHSAGLLGLDATHLFLGTERSLSTEAV